MRVAGLAGLLCAVILSAPAFAADMTSPMTPEVKPVEAGGWTFAVAPYFWAAGLSGHTSQFGSPTIDINQSFGDILKDLDFAAMGIVEARNGPFSLFGDLMYVKVSTDAATPRGVLAETVGLTSETFSGLAAAGYSLFNSDAGHLDIVGGVRMWSVKSDLSLSGGIFGGASFSDSATWADAVAGLRGNLNLTPKLYLTGWGMVGAGGADIDWDVAGGLGYNFNHTWSAVAGYRAMGVNYSNDDGFVFDVVQKGPILGVVIHF